LAVNLDVEPLLLEGTRRLDEWQVISNAISNPDEVFMVNPDFHASPDAPLNHNTWRVLSLINGRLPISAIVRLSNLGKFETYWALHALLQAELIVSNHGVPDMPGNRPAREGEAVESADQEENQARIEPVVLTEAAVKPKTRFFGFLNRTKISAGEPGEAEPVAYEPAGDVAGGPGECFTDAALICAGINRCLDALAAHGKFAKDRALPDHWRRFWRLAEQRYPKSDLIRFRRGRLSSRAFDRYVERNGPAASALTGVRADALAALGMFWRQLRDSALERLDRRVVDQIFDGAFKPFANVAPAASGAEFSLLRWQEEAA
jgi:hypothetical protein